LKGVDMATGAEPAKDAGKLLRKKSSTKAVLKVAGSDLAQTLPKGKPALKTPPTPKGKPALKTPPTPRAKSAPNKKNK